MRQDNVSWSFRLAPFNSIDMKCLRLGGTESFWHFFWNEPVNLKPSWLNMSCLMISAASCKVLASSSKSLSFKTFWSKFFIPSLKIMMVCLPSDCSCASGKCVNNLSFSLVLLTVLMMSKSLRRSLYKSYRSDSLKRSVPFSVDCSI